MCGGWYVLIGLLLSPIVLGLMFFCFSCYRDWRHPGYAIWSQKHYDEWMSRKQSPRTEAGR